VAAEASFSVRLPVGAWDCDGNADGRRDGSREGVPETIEGSEEGCLEGESDADEGSADLVLVLGSMDGESDGPKEGNPEMDGLKEEGEVVVGVGVGPGVGRLVGRLVGRAVGGGVGRAVGGGVGRAVAAGVGAGVVGAVVGTNAQESHVRGHTLKAWNTGKQTICCCAGSLLNHEQSRCTPPTIKVSSVSLQVSVHRPQVSGHTLYASLPSKHNAGIKLGWEASQAQVSLFPV